MFTVTCDLDGDTATGTAFEATTWITGHNAEHIAITKMDAEIAP